MPSVVALLVAAGRGERLGHATPKAFVPCAGRPLLAWSLDALHAVGEIEHIVAALPPGIGAPHGTIGVPGGAERSHSVRAALHAAPISDWVLVHDAARPMLTPTIVRACLDALAEHDCDAAIAAAPVADTIKEAASDVVVRTLDRTSLWSIQTPQAFRRDALERALGLGDAALAAATDDASLIESFGGEVRLVATSRENFKVTTPEDLHLAELILRDRTR
ncbi:MAG: 2-C-methyl-D-erythritol 4-phosphate cytidylyltransferase [Solirubrobacterales bacterium]|nr:2-C-methyl-D-erythritol 4-phosphate cytidylyltransferase [Solirubrobacterales bacterium]